VYRGDDIPDQDGYQVVFVPIETSTNPTALVALNITSFYGMLQNNSASLADAIQAFLQAPLPEETWVVLGEELWLPDWFKVHPRALVYTVCSYAEKPIRSSIGRKAMAIPSR